MKRQIILAAAVAAIFVISAAAANGATITPTVNVSATVQSVCTIITSPGAMSFDIDPSLAGPIPASVSQQPIVRCTNGKTATLTAESTNAGGGPLPCPILGSLNDGASTMSYTFTCPANVAGQGFSGAGKNVSLGIGGSIAAAAYQDATVSAGAGSYTDTVTVTVTY